MDSETRRQKVNALKQRLLAQESAVLSSMTPHTRACACDTYEQLSHTLQVNRRLQQYAVNLEAALAEANGSIDSREVQDIRQHLDEYMAVLYPNEWNEEKRSRGQA